MKKESSDIRIAIGLLIWAIAFLAFPKYVDMFTWLAWVFYTIGFIVLLVGIMGLCIDLKRK